LLDSAREHLEQLFGVMAGAVERQLPIVMLEPSCLAVFRDEAGRLAGDRPIVRAIAGQAVLFDAFIRAHLDRGDIPLLHRDALVHVHCHQRALDGVESTAGAMSAAGLRAEIPDAGCCGMAGSFGYHKTHYRVSVDVGERVLVPSVRAASDDTLIVADGFSCREQIAQLTERRAYHFAEVIHDRLTADSFRLGRA
jgi:Fe-S oxidoreductase